MTTILAGEAADDRPDPAVLIGVAYAVYERNCHASRRYVMEAFRIAMREPRKGLRMLQSTIDCRRLPQADYLLLVDVDRRLRAVPEVFTVAETRAFITAFENAFFASLSASLNIESRPPQKEET